MIRRRPRDSERVGPQLEERLRTSLRERATQLPVGPGGLARIRHRIGRGWSLGSIADRMPGGPKVWAPGLAALSVAGLVGVAALTAPDSPTASTESGGTVALPPTGSPAQVPPAPGRVATGFPVPPFGITPPAPRPSTQAPGQPGVPPPPPAYREGSDSLAQQVDPNDPSPSGTASAEPTPTATPSLTVAVYLTRTVDGTPRLFREFHTVATADDRVTTALEDLLSGDALDPDYGTVLPTLRLAGYSRETTVGVLRLTGDADLPGPVGLQQLVYTVGAADPAAESVEVLVNGSAVTETPLTRDPAALGPLWILDLEDGARVPVDFTAQGTAAAGGGVRWEVLSDDRQVAEGEAAVSRDESSDRWSWSAPLSLPGKGTYTLRVWSPDLPESAAEDKKLVTTG